MILTDGVWSLAGRNRYFLASAIPELRWLNEVRRIELAENADAEPLHVLMAVNDLNIDHETDMAVVDDALALGTRLLIDSGVFWLTNRHKRAHGITMDEALRLHPTQVDGFAWLLDRYVRIHERFGDRMWGMIELDQGGAERKRETRQRLHDLGIHPMPVYHPLVDGWDYFDELASTNDRMCFGNVVQADSATRQRLLVTAYERKRRYPHLWIHLLGYSLNELLHAAPVESCDSSSWKAGARWGRQGDTAMLASRGVLPRGFTYDREHGKSGDAGYDRSLQLGATIVRCADMAWRDHLTRLSEVLGHDEFR